MDFPYGSPGKESTCNAGDLGLIPGLGRSPGEGNGYRLQYSGLDNFIGCIDSFLLSAWELIRKSMITKKEVYGGFRLHIALSQIKSHRIWVKQASIGFIECVQIWEESRSIPFYFLNQCSTNKLKKSMNFNTEIAIELTKKNYDNSK